MAANTTLNLGTGGDVVRTIDRSGTGPKTQVVQLDMGGGGATESLVTAGQGLMAASLPVAIASNQSSIPVATTPASPATLVVSSTAAANTALTVTLPAAAGLFHYIDRIEIVRTATAALTGTATLVVTTTNLPGTLAWSFGNAMAAGGTSQDLAAIFPQGLKSSVVNTATTIVMPAPGAAVLWRCNVYYRTAA